MKFIEMDYESSWIWVFILTWKKKDWSNLYKIVTTCLRKWVHYIYYNLCSNQSYEYIRIDMIVKEYRVDFKKPLKSSYLQRFWLKKKRVFRLKKNVFQILNEIKIHYSLTSQQDLFSEIYSSQPESYFICWFVEVETWIYLFFKIFEIWFIFQNF